ncbi:MAG: hypothetical protein AAF518_03450 [Spirochaetota bacterium]
MWNKFIYRANALKTIIRVLNKHREKKDSLLFLLRCYMINRQEEQKLLETFPEFLLPPQQNIRQWQWLSGIYSNLEKEIGMPNTIAALTELVTSLVSLQDEKVEKRTSV